jgi:hypothetical protein
VVTGLLPPPHPAVARPASVSAKAATGAMSGARYR